MKTGDSDTNSAGDIRIESGFSHSLNNKIDGSSIWIEAGSTDASKSAGGNTTIQAGSATNMKDYQGSQGGHLHLKAGKRWYI